MKPWMLVLLSGSVAGLAGCWATDTPALVSPDGSRQAPPVTAEYTPGQVSVSPTINRARPSISASTMAGSGTDGGTDGTAATATFHAPEGLAVASDGTVYVAEPYAYRIRTIAPDGTVSTLAGGSPNPGRSDGTGSQASFMGPKDVAISPSGDLYVADFDAVRRISSGGQVTTLSLKNADGSAYQPIELFGIAADRGGYLFLAATYWIDRVSPDGTVTRYAGNDARGFADGPASRAYFNLPHKLAMDASGNLYVSDYGNLRIRRIAPDRTVTTIAGNGILGFTDGSADRSRLNFPSGLAVDAAGNVIVADTYNQAVREITPSGQISTLAGDNTAGYVDGSGTIEFQRPTDVAVRPDGGILVADSANNRIRLLR